MHIWERCPAVWQKCFKIPGQLTDIHMLTSKFIRWHPLRTISGQGQLELRWHPVKHYFWSWSIWARRKRPTWRFSSRYIKLLTFMSQYISQSEIHEALSKSSWNKDNEKTNMANKWIPLYATVVDKIYQSLFPGNEHLLDTLWKLLILQVLKMTVFLQEFISTGEYNWKHKSLK